MNLPLSLDREVVINARRATVFRFFTDSERWARWWGAGSSVDARPGGEAVIVYPGGATARGVVELVEPVERFVFTFGYDRPGAPIPPGGSRVTITLAEDAGGTRVKLHHEVPTREARDQHAPGWRYQLSVFADVVTRELAEGLTAAIDRYLGVWSERDAAARQDALAALCRDDVVYRDRFGSTSGRDDLDGHIAAAQHHLPAQLVREGEVRAALGMALVDWAATAGDRQVARGTSVVELDPDGRFARITGFWR